jgi:hypothetical protein
MVRWLAVLVAVILAEILVAGNASRGAGTTVYLPLVYAPFVVTGAPTTTATPTMTATSTVSSSLTMTPTPTPRVTVSPIATVTPPPTSASSHTATPTATRTITASTLTLTPTHPFSATPTVTSTPTRVATATRTQTATATAAQSPIATSVSAYFPVGPGFVDVIPHQIVRANDDRLYLFAAEASSPTTLVADWTASSGLPNGQSNFGGHAQVTLNASMISAAAAYDGASTIHVLANTLAGDLWDYPFSLGSDTFLAPTKLALGMPQPNTSSGFWWGTSGVSALVDTGRILHVAYWAQGNHIVVVGYIYNVSSNTLSIVEGPTQLDTLGNANHPALAISPLDGSLSVAWSSQASSPAQIVVASKPSGGSWSLPLAVSTAPVWTSPYFGLNVDQGPSFLITPNGTKRLTYIQDFDSTGDYGRIHYVENSGTGWIDTALNSYSHDPALAWDARGDLYILGHGHPNDANFGSSCTKTSELCTRKQNADGSWGRAQVFATPPRGDSFDASPSVKWSVVGFNRPETIEFLFYDAIGGNYNNTVVYYARFT